jgi:UDP-hydrolysing UDP-N-acetyl-D-glucosamine 2-epimerase
MKTIAIFTAARSEYGLMRNVIRKMNERFDVHLLVGGEHFSRMKGYPYNDILEDGLITDDKVVKVNFFKEGNSANILTESVAHSMKLFAILLAKQHFDAIVLMGDRYELFSITVPSMLFGIPILHISGGEVTEGAIDDNIRHATTKMSHLHFVANDIYAENVSRMGEEDWRIVICGECGLDNIHNGDVATEAEIHDKFGINLSRKCLLITYHPSTLEFDMGVPEQISCLLKALENFGEYELIFTAPGAEIGSEIIINRIEAFCRAHRNSHYVPHFGSRHYLTLMRNADAIIGNSSSGLVEAASLDTPAVNVGDRQKNRLSAASVLHTGYDPTEISNAIKKAMTEDFKELARKAVNPYDPHRDSRNSERIVYAVDSFFSKYSKQQRLVKKFDTEVKKEKWDTMLSGFK